MREPFGGWQEVWLLWGDSKVSMGIYPARSLSSRGEGAWTVLAPLSRWWISRILPYNLRPATDGDRDRDPHQSNGLSSQGPVEGQDEGEDEQESEDPEGGWSTNWGSVPVLMGAHQIQLDWDWMSMWSNRTLWLWLTMGADWEAIDKGTGTCFYGMYWLFGTLVYMDAQLPRPGCSREGLDLHHPVYPLYISFKGL